MENNAANQTNIAIPLDALRNVVRIGGILPGLDADRLDNLHQWFNLLQKEIDDRNADESRRIANKTALDCATRILQTLHRLAFYVIHLKKIEKRGGPYTIVDVGSFGDSLVLVPFEYRVICYNYCTVVDKEVIQNELNNYNIVLGTFLKYLGKKQVERNEDNFRCQKVTPSTPLPPCDVVYFHDTMHHIEPLERAGVLRNATCASRIGTVISDFYSHPQFNRISADWNIDDDARITESKYFPTIQDWNLVLWWSDSKKWISFDELKKFKLKKYFSLNNFSLYLTKQVKRLREKYNNHINIAPDFLRENGFEILIPHSSQVKRH